MATPKSQNYANHRHNPKMSGIGFLFLLIAAVSFALRWFYIGGRYTMALGMFCVLGALWMLLSISRVYTTKLQDRIIKLEMRVRGMTLLTSAQQGVLARLSKSQIVALRFASDQELPGLVERADREKLSADQIKQAITNWVPDWDRT
jgi:UDP-N-acetylmuramyl pentapeptide phosphotransferase/UDP-N-acetylglucosamine-1-phosphate transferase